jgi:hypothetical protein
LNQQSCSYLIAPRPSILSFVTALAIAIVSAGCGEMLVTLEADDSGTELDAGRGPRFDGGLTDSGEMDAGMADAGRDASVEPDGGADAGRPEGIDLGAAAAFAVLAGSTVTSTGLSVVNGDLGLSPGSALEGFPPGVVNGDVHIGDEEAIAAGLALTDAFNDARGRTEPAPISVSGNLGGRTLTPGIYVSGSSLEITSGDLTLDALGDENAVWIFQMPSAFTMTSGRAVILSGDARAANIYWQVGSSATLGSTCMIAGNILADQSITLETGATLNGRALTRTGAVTLDSSVITIPAL